MYNPYNLSDESVTDLTIASSNVFKVETKLRNSDPQKHQVSINKLFNIRSEIGVVLDIWRK